MAKKEGAQKPPTAAELKAQLEELENKQFIKEGRDKKDLDAAGQELQALLTKYNCSLGVDPTSPLNNIRIALSKIPESTTNTPA